ncbi:kelch-like protein 2 [Metopolophium dirhodum]|uniref:kelch-like protein 2 n=1 Tax=Metopolophium dirhodum TaxID=44670 RepID=UPI00298F8434|nr:kelch-like protein 2 [Metopolophium dirhodum]
MGRILSSIIHSYYKYDCNERESSCKHCTCKIKVGGYDQSRQTVNTVECYNPTIDTWSPVANMYARHSGAAVGVLNGELYVVGGDNGSFNLSSVKKYSPITRVWTSVADLLLPRVNAEVVALDGLLYVVGGMYKYNHLFSVECYNPNTNRWTMVTAKWNMNRLSPGVVTINRSRHFTSC